MAVDRSSFNTETPSLGDLAGMAAVHTVLSLVDTVKIAQVTGFDDETQRASVKLLQLVPYEDGEDSISWEAEEPVEDIPVLFPGSGSQFGIGWKVKPGDFVLLLINERSLDEYKTTGEIADQTDARRWDLQDAIALPLRDMRTPLTLPESDAMVLTAPEVRLVSSSASASVSRDPEVQTNLASIQASIAAIKAFKLALSAALVSVGVGGPSQDPTSAASFSLIYSAINAISIPDYTTTSTAVEEVKVP